MREELNFIIDQRMERTAKALRRNRMLCTCVDTVEEVVPLLKSLLPAGALIGNGRSATLEQCGVMDLVQNGDYDYIDKYAAKTEEEKWQMKARVINADFFLASANAITENGEIYELDGHASRIGPIAFGPKNVILVAGYNKIVADLAAAEYRVRSIAAPANAKRQNSATPCVVTGKCENCHSPGRICCSTLILGPQRIENRIHVILVKEALGY